MDFSQQLILNDFDTFLDFLNEKSPISLTISKALMKGKDLVWLNAKMQSFQTQFVSEKNQQDIFVLLQTFFFIAEKAKIIEKKASTKGNERLLYLNIERAKLYDALSDNEKYFFLLDSFWAHINWRAAYDTPFFYGTDFFLKLATKYPINTKVAIEDAGLKRKGEIQYTSTNFMGELMMAFGLLKLEWDTTLEKRSSKYDFPYQTAELTPLGKKILPQLFSQYGINTIGNFLFPMEDEDEENQIDEPVKLSEVFKLAFPDWDIENKLLPIEHELISGVYHFKVSLDKKCYRVIEIGGNDSFESLHLAIQDAFDFDNDHLYAFFMDNIAWSDDESNSYWSDYCDDKSYFAADMLIGKVGLSVGKEFLYLFDFGSSWYFQIVVEGIFPDAKEPIGASVIKSVGESPEQYEDWE